MAIDTCLMWPYTVYMMKTKTTLVLGLETYRLVHAPRDAKYTPQRGYDAKNRIINRAQKIANETGETVELMAPKSQGSQLLATFNPIR